MLFKSIIKKLSKTDLFVTMKHSAVFFSSNVATQAVTFILMPFLTRMLTDAEFGYLELFKSYMFLGATFFSLNSYASVARYYYEKEKDFDKFIGSTFFLCLLFFVISTVFLLPNTNFVAELLDIPVIFPVFILISSFFVVILRIFQFIVIHTRRSKDDLMVSVARALNILLLTVVLVSIMDTEKYLGYIYAVLISGFITSLIIFYKLRNEIRPAFKLSHIKYILNYSVPLLPYHISAILLSHFSKMMINSYDGAGAAGIYSAAANIGMIISVINLATNRAIFPDFFKFYDKGEYKRLDQLVRKVFSIVCLAALFFVFFAKEILLIMASKKFEAALPIIPVIVLTYVFDSVYLIYARYVVHSKKTIYMALALIIAGIITVLLNIVLIPKYGFLGGAYSNLIAYFILSILVIIIADNILKYNITPYKIFLKPILLLLFFSAVNYIDIFYDINIVLEYILKILLLFAFVYFTMKNEMMKIFKK